MPGDATNTYDFIVTGAGSAGCAVAGRLSENGKYKVLLLEAGTKDTNPWIHIPLGYTKTYTDPRVNWMFDSEPEKELNGRTLYQPRGKVLGGTSSINGMVYMRGTPTDYDGWRQKGCEGWGYDDVLPFFKKAEDQERGAERVPRRRRAAACVEPGALGARRRDGQGGDRGRGARQRTTSTAPPRKASATTRRPPPTGGAGRRRAPISAPPRAAPI